MTLDTNFNLSPYFDDFDEEKNFHRVLFKPGVAVQARELTQIQTILQNQIERFGNNILVEGTIITGCNFTEVRRLGYIKIRDLQTGNPLEGAPVNVNMLKDMRAVGLTTGVEAYVREVASGLESQSPNLNTLFVKYLSTGNNGQKEFSQTEQIQIKNFTTDELIATVSAAGEVETNSVGFGYGVIVGDGIIYQKGSFVRVDEQLTIVSRYTNQPDGIVVGFQTAETIVNSNQDTSLLDNAQGFNNYTAPGADRLVLTPILTAKTLAQAQADETFFAIQEYRAGRIVRRNRTTQYSTIYDMIERRTSEESGSYIVKNFNVRIGEHPTDDTKLNAYVGAGLAYINGKRVELLGEIPVEFDKATSTKTEDSQNIATNYGNYINVNEYLGVFPTDQAIEVSIYDDVQQAANNAGMGSPSGSAVGTAKLRAFTYQSGTVGDPSAVYRAYLFDIRLNSGKSFEDDAKSIVYNGTSAQADIILDPIYNNKYELIGSKARLKEAKFNRMIYPIGRTAVGELNNTSTTYIYNKISSVNILTNGTISLPLSGNEEWSYGDGNLNATQKQDFILVAQATNGTGGYVINTPIDLTSAIVNVNASTNTLTISGLTNPDATVACKLYHSVKVDTAPPALKDLVDVYVKIDVATHANGTNGEYTLGVPDVYSIESIWKGTSYSEGSPSSDVTSQFTLITNQKDNYYDLSKIKASPSLSIGGTDKILVKVKAFKKNTSVGNGYFSINSYPVDDTTGAANNTIGTIDIPSYKSSSGTLYQLRDVIDFRPYATNTAAYAETDAAATENPTSTVSFGSSNLYIPKPNGIFTTTYDYYMGRKDYLYIDADKNFTTIKGLASENPVPPSEPNTGLVLATITIPPYPTEIKRTADRAGKSNYGVTFKKRSAKGYTMKDIANIDKRVTNLEYYVSLNALEQSAINLLVSDEANLNRFKNGIFVDNFNDLSIANLISPEFAAAIDPSYKEITPKFQSFPISLKGFDKANWTGVSDHANTAVTLSYTQDKFIEQPYATSYRSCTTDFYNFAGIMYISPVHDVHYDTNVAPDAVIDIDLVTPFQQFSDNLNNFIPLQGIEIGRANTAGEWVANEAGTQETLTWTETVTTQSLSITPNDQTNVQHVGEYVTDVRFNPFMVSKDITVVVYGLRPNTEHFFFFDDTPISQYMYNATYIGNDTPNGEIDTSKFVKIGDAGVSITSDASGTVSAIFRLPAETFYVGDRKIRCIDVDSLDSVDAASSKAEATYHAFSFDISKQNITVSTRNPEIQTNIETTDPFEVTGETRAIPQNTGGGGGGGSDPISQTFTIRPEHSDDNVVMVTGADLFFNQKSTQGNGVTIELRETINGYPASQIIPFSRRRLNVTQVNESITNADGSTTLVPTSISFDAPVTLKTGKQYAITVIPEKNDPDYRIWVSRTGQRDVATGLAITNDFSDGTLFTSTNNIAWTAHQSENMTLSLYKANYTSTEGTIKLTNRNNEFLMLENIVGTFTGGEKIGILAANLASTVAVTAESSTVTGSSTTFLSDFEVGDYFAVYRDASTIDTFKVSAIANNTSMTIEGYPASSNTAANYFATRVGTMKYYNADTPAKMMLEDSTVKPSLRFQAGNQIFGDTSGAIAEISTNGVIDQNVSYIQPNIQRINFGRTTNTLAASKLTNTSGGTYAKDIYFNASNFLTSAATVIKSRSNEISGGSTNGSEKSFVLTMTLENRSVYDVKSSSSFIDYGISGAMVTEYLVNSPDPTNEDTITGDATSKYISKTVALAEDLDADDFKVYLTAHRPSGTNIEVYGRFMHAEDSRTFDEIPWTLLTPKPETENLFASAANRFSYREYEFNAPTVATAADLTNGGGAALNEDDSNIITYKEPNGAIRKTYKYFAIKVVMLSDSHANVPRLKDIRALALS